MCQGEFYHNSALDIVDICNILVIYICWHLELLLAVKLLSSFIVILFPMCKKSNTWLRCVFQQSINFYVK